MTASVEIVVWPATDAYINDHTLIDPAAANIGKSEGVLKMYTGVQTEEPNAYMVTVWDDIKSHQKVIANQELFASQIASLQPTMSSPPTSIIHANFQSDYTPVFAAPVTEFALVTPKPGVDRKMTEAKVHAIALMAGVTPGCKAISGTWGPVVEKDETFLLVLGWLTVEDHWEEIKTGPLTEPVKELLSENDIALTHAKLRSQVI